MSGLKIAALYGISPHKLGFCGPREKSTTKTLLDYLSGQKISQKKIRRILRSFKGAYPYYKLIAKANRVPDPFDERVVKAYWVGNKLLERVKIDDLRLMIKEEFSKPGFLRKEIAFKKSKEIPANSKPHHNFHVLILGSVTGRIILKGKLLDLCRISWGKVKKIKGKKIIVEYQPLTGRKKLDLGKPIEKEFFWDKKLVTNLKIGDWVSLHWNNAVQKLQNKDIENLKKYTKITFKVLTEMKNIHTSKIKRIYERDC